MNSQPLINRTEFMRILLASVAGTTLSAFVPTVPRPATGQKVIVVGAGMAGAAAADSLRQQGFDVVVLEARNRLGGRIHTDLSWGSPIELGASWIHRPRGNPLVALSGKLGVATRKSSYANGNLLHADGDAVHKRRLARMVHLLDKATRRAANALHHAPATTDYSLYEAVRHQLTDTSFSVQDQEVLDFLEDTYENDLACSLKDNSARMYLSADYGSQEGDLFVTGGYANLVSHLLNGVDVQLTTVVRAIRQSSTGVRVETNHAVFDADHVVVTLPLGVLQRNEIEFVPKLPAQKIDAINALRPGLMNKVVMQFDTKFWPDKQFIGLLGAETKNQGILVNHHRYTGKPILIALSVDQAARQLEQQDPAAIQSFWQRTLHKIWPHKPIEFTNLQTTAWQGDSFSRGSYVHVPVGGSVTSFEAMAAPVGRIRFAGEATIAQHNSYTHGAYLSGLREADALARYA